MIGSETGHIISIVTALLAIYGIYKAYNEVRDRLMARTIRLTVPINQGEEDFLRAVEGLVNKTRNIDITIDFSMWDEFSMSLAEETDMGALIEKPASEVNNQMIPIYRRQPRERGFPVIITL